MLFLKKPRGIAGHGAHAVNPSPGQAGLRGWGSLNSRANWSTKDSRITRAVKQVNAVSKNQTKHHPATPRKPLSRYKEV